MFRDWDYESMGFRSEQELKESYERVMKRLNNPKSEIELEIERYNEMKAELEANNNLLDTTKLMEGARLQELDRIVENRIISQLEEEKRKAEQEEMQKLFRGLAEKIREEKEAEAEREFEKERQKLSDELQDKIYGKHGVKTERQKQLDEAYSKLLKGF